ncbi:MAG: NADH-quinone oxidoreductase subunit C [Armatimonadota bacterium]
MAEQQATDTTAAAPAAPQIDVSRELERIRAAHPEAVVDVEKDPARGMVWIQIRRRYVVPVLTLLRDDPSLKYTMLADLTCVDKPWEERRFTVIYNLLSIPHNRRIFLRVKAADGEAVPSAVPVHAAADWAEREVWDLFGVKFEGHPDLTRIELPDDWEGHPLRKDYPAVGPQPVILYNDVKDVL